MEVYNEQIRDLLSADSGLDLPIHEDRERGFFVKDLTEVIVTSVAQVLDTLANGERNRHFGRTDMNEMSSRSHCIFRVVRVHIDCIRSYICRNGSCFSCLLGVDRNVAGD